MTNIKKVLLSLTLATTIISSCFLIPISADTITIDGETLTVDSYSKVGNIFKEIVKNGVRYKVTGWANENVSNNNLWVKSVAQGVLTADVVKTVIGLDYWTNKASETADDLIGWSKSYVQSGWDSIQNQLKDGTFEPHGSLLTKKLLGAVGTIDGVSKSLVGAIDDVNNYVQESSYRNYYSTPLDNTNTYARGNTSYYTTYNDTTNQFYDTYNNTYEYVTNYNYDIYNNYYNYYTQNDYHYQIINNYNNTYVFNVTDGIDYELYYELPNGSNSFNLTEDDVRGIRTDFNVSNYEINYIEDDNLLSLYHFNGSLNTLTNDDYLTGGLIFDGVNFVDSYKGFDLGLMHIINLPMNYTQSTSTEFYCCKSNSSTSCSWLSNGPTSNYPNIMSSRSSIKYNSYFSILGNLFEFDNVSDIKNIRFMMYYDSVGQLFFTSKSNLNSQISSYALSTLDTLQSQTYTNSSDNVIDINRGWNYFEFNYNNGSYDVYNNGILINSVPSLDNFYLGYNQSCLYPYFIVDELSISSSSNSNHDIKYAPYDNNFYYTLPNVDTNNKLLIQSTIPVNNYQFGGVRNLNNELGDVYINLIDGVIDSIQQFDGTNWIKVDAAIYSDKLAKWVNAIGYSIYLNDFSYTDITANDVIDDTTMAKWLSGTLNNLRDMINENLLGIKDMLKDLVDKKEQEDLVEKDLAKDINGYLDDAIEKEQDIADNLEEKTITKYVNLASTINKIYEPIHDNGMDILFIAPLIACIVRLII